MQHDIHAGLECNQREQQSQRGTQPDDQEPAGDDGDMHDDDPPVGCLHQFPDRGVPVFLLPDEQQQKGNSVTEQQREATPEKGLGRSRQQPLYQVNE